MHDKIRGFKATHTVTTEELQLINHMPEEYFQRRVKEKLLKDLIEQIEKHIEEIPIEYSRDEKGMYIEYAASLYFTNKAVTSRRLNI